MWINNCLKERKKLRFVLHVINEKIDICNRDYTLTLKQATNEKLLIKRMVKLIQDTIDKNILKCLKCPYMEIVNLEDGCGASSKCFKTSKRGKTITWAMTTISPKEEGKDRVIKILNSKNAPSWCPIKM